MKDDFKTSDYKGSCLCGQVTFSVASIGNTATHCHCTMCRKFHGAAFGTLVSVNGLQWLKGQEHLQHFKAPNGTVRTFCNTCGSSLGFRNARGGEFEFAIATFDDPIPVHVSAHIYTAYRAHWYVINDGLPCHAEGLKDN